MKYWLESLYLVCIWNAQCFAMDEIESINDDTAEKICSCDYTRLEIQLEQQLNQQQLLFYKINELSLQMKGMEAKLFENPETEREVPLVNQPIDESIIITTEIRDKLQEHDNMLAKILDNQNFNQELCKKNDLEDHTQTLKNAISDKIIALQRIDTKPMNIERDFMENTNSLEATNNQYIQQHLNATGTYLKSVNSTSNSQSYLSYCLDNKHLIKNYQYGPEPFLIPCREGGGVWTVIQRRIDGSVDFYRGLTEYKSGFGNLDGEFFIGLEKLHDLTSTFKPVELLIILEDFKNVTKYAKYDDFQVGNETENYKLIKLGSYAGDAGDSFSQHLGFGFSTKDHDTDGYPNRSCAQHFKAAWWYHACYNSNLNGKYYQHPTKFYNATIMNSGINWNSFRGDKYSLKSVQMLIRPRKFETN